MLASVVYIHLVILTISVRLQIYSCIYIPYTLSYNNEICKCGVVKIFYGSGVVHIGSGKTTMSKRSACSVTTFVRQKKWAYDKGKNSDTHSLSLSLSFFCRQTGEERLHHCALAYSQLRGGF
jgi:hypothetical protein